MKVWFGVLSEKHRTGIGTHLLTVFEDEMMKNGIKLIQVSTLGDRVDYPPYEGVSVNFIIKISSLNISECKRTTRIVLKSSF